MPWKKGSSYIITPLGAKNIAGPWLSLVIIIWKKRKGALELPNFLRPGCQQCKLRVLSLKGFDFIKRKVCSYQKKVSTLKLRVLTCLVLFQIAYEGDFWSLCTVTFWLYVDFLISTVCYSFSTRPSTVTCWNLFHRRENSTVVFFLNMKAIRVVEISIRGNKIGNICA